MNINALSHTHDPEVSELAAIEVTKGPKSEQVMRAIVQILTDHEPMTPDQIETAYMRRRAGEIGWPELTSRSFVQKRVSEMKTHVLVADDGIGRPVLRSEGKPANRAQPVTLNHDPMTALEAITDYWKDAA